MRIIIDGDGCPVAKQAVALAKSHRLNCIIFCDTSHQIHNNSAQTITVDKGADSVDFALVNALKPGDIVVTQDYSLAAMRLSRNAQPIHQDGLVYTAENMILCGWQGTPPKKSAVGVGGCVVPQNVPLSRIKPLWKP